MSAADVFEPTAEPARSLYHVIRAAMAATTGHHRSDDYETAIRVAHTLIWQAVDELARQDGKIGPRLADVAAAETTALGHVDYTAKYAYRLAEMLADAPVNPLSKWTDDELIAAAKALKGAQ